ncbi:DUF4932 domain-containing protein [Parapedobacter luteus]|uniref:DUF4932 domain-containing protein n=1 Tax=Parapedobacter luteus TaxID=623280 RepID=UPI0015900EA7|nr:DUF4932 domain-containing protein [Parapedobacter luteus]
MVEVHKGTELLHIINYLAGVYSPAVQNSSYRKAVDEWFVNFKDHPVLDVARKLPYNDFVDLGWCIQFPDYSITFPEKYGYFDQIVDKNLLANYLTLSTEFAKASDFMSFFDSQEDNYSKWENQFLTRLREEKPLQALGNFYQIPLRQKIYFSISPMGVVLRANIFQAEISPENKIYAPVIIPFDNRFIDNESKEPNFKYSRVSLNNNVWHEVSHLYWEYLNAPYRDEILALKYADSLSINFKTFESDAQNTYSYIHEIIADAVTIFLKKKYIGVEEAEEHLSLNESYGSPLYRKVVNLIENEYWDNREKINFQEFTPQIIALIKEEGQ